MTVFAAAADGYRTNTTSSIDRAIRLSTAAAVLAVAGVAAYVSYWHAYAVVRAHGESGITARLEPATIDGLVYASSMVVLYAARHRVPVPSLARWLLGLGIAATLTANMARAGPTDPSGRWSRPGRRSVSSARMSCWSGSSARLGRQNPGRRPGTSATPRPQPPAPSSAAGASATHETRYGSLRLRSPGRQPPPPAGSVTRW
jgi:hypothetical protein